METVTYEVGRMSCQGCVSNLTNALEQVEESVNQIEVGCIIEHEGVSTDALEAAITGAGFLSANQNLIGVTEGVKQSATIRNGV